MASISDEFAKLSNPTPHFSDLDDEYTEPPSTKLENEHKNLFRTSRLRSQNAARPENADQTYIGRKVTRKAKGLMFNKKNIGETETKEEAESSELSKSETDDDEISEDDGLDEEDLMNFKKDLKNESASEEEESTDQSSSNSGDEETEKDDMVAQFANINVNSEIEKGKAIKAQQEIWDKLCECRIKLQKLLIVANKLPQTDTWFAVKKCSGQEMAEADAKANDALESLLNCLINLKQELSQNRENKMNSPVEEEILSDSEAEHPKEDNKAETNIKKGVKRKYQSEDFEEILSKQFESEKPWRNSVVQEWDEKVRLSTGRMTQKSFNAFGNSALKQIEQILQDKTRLTKRTQLKRSVYRVLGKPEFTNEKDHDSTTEEPSTSKQDLLLKDYDPEIFDDDDFYRQLLKDIIQSKSAGMDPLIVRKQMELQKIRNKMKRKVDTKASKGRKLRYDIHPKLVNFMAPVRTTTISDSARDNLMKSLFGRSSIL